MDIVWSTIIACVELLAGIIDMWHFVLFLLQLEKSHKSIPHIIHGTHKGKLPQFAMQNVRYLAEIPM